MATTAAADTPAVQDTARGAAAAERSESVRKVRPGFGARLREMLVGRTASSSQVRFSQFTTHDVVVILDCLLYVVVCVNW